MPRRQMSLNVVGADYPNKRGPTRRFEIALCKPGEPVDLVPEPKNPKDEYAVAVYSCRGVQLGYVPAERAPLVGGWITKKRITGAVFQSATDYGAVIRVGIDGEAPTLPDSSIEQRHQPPDFWPDPIYDDD